MLSTGLHFASESTHGPSRAVYAVIGGRLVQKREY